jgi:Uma2 family endonuclease
MVSNLAYKLDEEYTYADYLYWDEDTRYEIIDGIAYMMASPSAVHQAISGELFGEIREF